jgi:catechol 2,3-dioxygenase-like lactoylglutathione lyase family enzyme
MREAKLVPELMCSDFEVSLRFYVEVLGFAVVYARAEDRFGMLEREGARIMIEQPVGRAWVTSALVQPFGRGVNFEIECSDVDGLYGRVRAAGATVFLEIEEKWYRRDAARTMSAPSAEVGNRQFIVQDPDGYLLRFAQDLGERARAS